MFMAYFIHNFLTKMFRPLFAAIFSMIQE